jgi:1,4-alpha-glucan branching enzyme
MMQEVGSGFQHSSYLPHDPHAFLGLHEIGEGKKVIRLLRPGASDIYLEVFGKQAKAKRVDAERGIFEFVVPATTTPLDYKVYHQSGLLTFDPYAFLPSIGEIDTYLFPKGVHYEIYEILGAHLIEHQGVLGCRFAVWAPSAREVALVADVNHWDGRINPMRSLGSSGIWELFVPGLKDGEKYKFEIRGQDGNIRIKADPYAFSSEKRPHTASIVSDVDLFKWSDETWMQKRRALADRNYPINIYELHLGSWKRNEHGFLNYRELAEQLASYCKYMGYTHVEIMPLAEHPLDESWGYQVTGFYSVTSRYGKPEDFQYFVNHMHENDIGVILDFVPAHFPTDDFALAQFDGTALYEHLDPRQGFHPHWNTCIFNYGRNEVSNFLLGSALYWVEKMHIDGFRVDAVASMLYLNYGRNEGEWIPNVYGGKENIEAIEFLKHFNSILHERYPGILTFAEESTAFTGVSHPLEWGGLGFDLKWNMGWMNDTLRYIEKDPFYRHHHHNELTFSMIYAYSERFVLPISHDEVVHGKRNLISKMPSDDWQKFANMRLLFGYMMCHPGKKLRFMGTDFAQWDEWNCKDQIHWFLLNYPSHRGIHNLVRDLNHFYLKNAPLWRYDFTFEGFEWIDCNDRTNSVISQLRKSENAYLACVHNFTPTCHFDYFVGLKNVKSIREVFNTDSKEYGGSGKINHPISIVKNEHGQIVGFTTVLAPLATMIFEVEF